MYVIAPTPMGQNNRIQSYKAKQPLGTESSTDGKDFFRHDISFSKTIDYKDQLLEKVE